MAYQARIRSTWSAFVACCWTKSPSGPSTICDAELWHWKPNGTDGEWRMSVTSCKLCSMFHSNSHNLSNRKVKTLPSVRFLHANSLFSLYPIQTLLNIHFTDLTEGNSLGEILVLVNRLYFLETAKGGPKFSWATSCGTIHLLAVGEKQGWPSQDVMKRYHGTAALEWVAKHQPLVPGTIIRWRENIDNRH